jgi:hypothetical protein
MHHRKQISTTSIYRIHTPKSGSESSASRPSSDTKNARLAAKKRIPDTLRIKPSAARNIPSHLDRFARAHDFVTEIREYSDADNDIHFVPCICLDDVYISDPVQDPFLSDVLGSKKIVRQAVEETQLRDPLVLILMDEQVNRLKRTIEFDLPTFEICYVALHEDPNDSNWGRILSWAGIRYLHGCDEGICLLFSADDGPAVALASALARIH